MLSRAGGNINARGALIHVFGDLLGSVAALVAGAVIYWTGWTPIDPILSIVVALLILRSTLAAPAPVDRRAHGAACRRTCPTTTIGDRARGAAGGAGRPRPARVVHERGPRRAVGARACSRDGLAWPRDARGGEADARAANSESGT